MSFSENQKGFLKFDDQFPRFINTNVLLVCQYGRKVFIDSEVFQEKKISSHTVTECKSMLRLLKFIITGSVTAKDICQQRRYIV